MRVLALSFAAVVVGLPAMAETPIMSVPEIADAMAAEQMILLDIRSREEWEETGVAEGAWPVSMHEKDFGTRLQQILTAYTPDQIAVICATGGRTAHVTQLLRQHGISGVADVSEGMEGSRRGPGWIKRGLPVVTLEEAAATYEAAIATN